MRAKWDHRTTTVALAAGLSAAFLIDFSCPAWAAEAARSSASAPVFLAEILVLLVTGRVLGELMQRLKQPPVMGQLLAGILLGPSVLGLLFPHARAMLFPSSETQKSMIEGLSQLGILMLLLLTGMETDLGLVRKVRGPALLIAATGITVPFACGFALGQFLPVSLIADPGKRLLTSLFLGTALSISSIKIVAIVVREMNFMRRNLGQIIVASAILEDTAGWIIISVTLGIASAGTVSAFALAKTVAGTALFLGLSLTIGRPLVFWLIRWVNDTFRIEFAVITAILVIMGVMALITSALGVQSVLGAFVAGVLIGESPILTRHIDEQLRGLIAALFMPVFFGLAGLGADLRILANPQLLALTAGLLLVASLGKFAGAWTGALLGGLSSREALALGCAMNARGSTEIIVASIGLQQGALSRNLFTMIVTMAVLTTSLMPPMLRKALSGLPMRAEERARLEREEVDARGFVGSLERLLLAVDTSATGRLAAQFAGIVAGVRGLPLTIVELKNARSQSRAASDAAVEAVESGAAASAASVQEEELPASRKVDVSKAEEGAGGVAEIARKGFDLLFVGIAGACTPDGHLSRKLARVVADSPATLAILAGGEGASAFALPQSGARILVPVTGTDASRCGAEIAFVLARALTARVTALYVTRWQRRESGRAPARLSLTRRNEEAVLKEIVRLGARYDVDVRTVVEAQASPDAPILRHAANHDLVIMGVNRRQGDGLFLGNTAAAILQKRKDLTLFIAS